MQVKASKVSLLVGLSGGAEQQLRVAKGGCISGDNVACGQLYIDDGEQLEMGSSRDNHIIFSAIQASLPAPCHIFPAPEVSSALMSSLATSVQDSSGHIALNMLFNTGEGPQNVKHPLHLYEDSALRKHTCFACVDIHTHTHTQSLSLSLSLSFRIPPPPLSHTQGCVRARTHTHTHTHTHTSTRT
jgi:hypothetical protein